MKGVYPVTAYGIIKFLHIAFVAAWFGGASLMAMFLRDAICTGETGRMDHALNRAQRWNLTMFIPTSVIVLLTGIYMMLQFDGDKPLWLLVKERFGSLFILAFILVIVLYGRKALAKVKSDGIEKEQVIGTVKRYIMLLNISVLCMVVLMFFASVKL